MRIEINIDKKHFIVLCALIVLVGVVIVMGAGGQYKNDGTPLNGVGHPDLYADYISSWTQGNPIQVNDPQGISFGIGDNPDLYSIRATPNAVRYGNADTINVFEGKICSSYTDGRTNNCISIEKLISNNKFTSFSGGDIIGPTGLRYRLVGQLTQTDPGLSYVSGPRNIGNTFDSSVGRRSAKTFCLEKGYNDVIEFTSAECPSQDTPTIYNKQGDGERTYTPIHSGCFLTYGIINYVKCV